MKIKRCDNIYPIVILGNHMPILHPISVVIPCFNVDKFIRPTLESLKWCNEVIIVDMFSTDSTKEICLEYSNVKFYENKDFIYANVNYGIDKASNLWILRLDSDEIVTTELKNEIIEFSENYKNFADFINLI